MGHLRDTTAEVAPPCRSGICDSDHIQVEHNGTPELGEHKRSSRKSDRKTQEDHCDVTIGCCEAGARDTDNQQ